MGKKTPGDTHYSLKSEYKRAYMRGGNSVRNRFWRQIVSMTPYDVEILFESDSETFIKEKEVEFIKLYGKIHDNSGTLANITNGGDDKSVFSEIGEINFGKMPVYAYSIDGRYIGFYKSRKDAKERLGIKTCITNVFNNGGATSKYQLFDKYMGVSVQPKYVLDKRNGYSVFIKYNSDKEGVVFSSLLKAANYVGVSYSTLKYRLEKHGFYKNFTIKYSSK